MSKSDHEGAAGHRVSVEICGKTLTFAIGPDQTAEQVQEAARLIDERMRQAQSERSDQSLVQTAVLASLNLVDELFKLQSEYQAAESDIAQRTSRLSASLDKLLEDSGAGDSTTAQEDGAESGSDPGTSGGSRIEHVPSSVDSSSLEPG